ncbi:MAG: MerR family transcriptional regulator [Clostridia bacterium]|nr:MerR family transcriptional regulator [Clostridia bacterium]
MKTVKQISKATGISVRALHHYDAIGLLPPTAVTEAGYRLYDDAALKRLGTIMLFRELEMPLGEIKTLLDSPEFNEKAALRDQHELLKLKARRLDRLIALTDKLIKGDGIMDFSAFDNSETKEYAAEARRRWGDTDAYREFELTESARDPAERASAADGLMRIFTEFGELKRRGESESGEGARAAVLRLQAYISKNYYSCTDTMLGSLGEMYVSDARFKANIDSVGGEGTAEYVNEAILAHINGL